MAHQRSCMKPANTTPSSDINSLINAANKNDRFKLLEDDAVLPADLTNPVHPLFHQLAADDQLHLALQLASHFLLHDQTLEFFVPLLYGHEMQDLRSKKYHLCDPLVRASSARQARLLSSVRQALQCLAKHLIISFVHQEQQRTYAKTVSMTVTSPLTSSCCLVFQGKLSPKIEIYDAFLRFYKDPDGYTKVSRCAQYRHDFLFAVTLVHEVVHAVGVMRRGNLKEPYYRSDSPETEWGYAWENFMFGSILNPQDKNGPGTHLLMRRVWADTNSANGHDCKEYCDVPMSWIAQWFRTETWSLIAEKGPTAIALPTTHFKIQASHKLGAWLVYSDSPEVLKDIADLYTGWQLRQQPSQTIYYYDRTTAELQESNMPVPPRLRKVPESSIIRDLLSSPKPDLSFQGPLSIAYKPLPPATAPLVPAYRKSSPCTIQQKRRADAEDDYDYSQNTAKRGRS